MTASLVANENLNLGSEFRREPPNTKVSGTVCYPRFHFQGNGNDASVLVGLTAMFKSDYDCGCCMRLCSVPYTNTQCPLTTVFGSFAACNTLLASLLQKDQYQK